MKTIVVIPARLESLRLPNKILLNISGKTLIQRVYEQVKKAKNIDDIYIATDSKKIYDVVNKFGGKSILTSSKHKSGTDRIAEAIENIQATNIINVQGDEPLINPDLIDNLVEVFQKNKDIYFATAMIRIKNPKDLDNPNVVKVITDLQNNAIYFSRSKIPFSENIVNNYFKHIGIYIYKKDFLLKYSRLNQTPLEKMESLEQLRAIENGFKIQMIETNYESIGVDTLEDLEKVREIIKNEEN